MAISTCSVGHKYGLLRSGWHAKRHSACISMSRFFSSWKAVILSGRSYVSRSWHELVSIMSSIIKTRFTYGSSHESSLCYYRCPGKILSLLLGPFLSVFLTNSSSWRLAKSLEETTDHRRGW